MRFFVLAILLLNSCTTMAPARLYNLSDGSNISVEFSNFQNGYGRATAQLKSGEKLEGEYTLRIPHRNYHTVGPYYTGRELVTPDSTKSSVPSNDEPSWAEVYGYGSEAEAEPVGTGTLVGNNGTIIHLVSYSVDMYRNVGDGVARSNQGKWYRFHVGMLD